MKEGIQRLNKEAKALLLSDPKRSLKLAKETERFSRLPCKDFNKRCKNKKAIQE